MKGAETLRALADGKTLRGMCGLSFKLFENEIVMKYHDSDVWRPIGWAIDYEMEIVEEYTLTFKEAMQEALNGKKVTSEVSICVYFFNNDGKVVTPGSYGGEEVINYPIDHEEINAKWRVVE